jgi:hypothetical protein
LHVPELQNNLLSVLHLVTHHEFKATIEGTCMEFSQHGALQFTASICENTAFMDVITPVVVEAALASCEPLSHSLWHCCLCHISTGKLEQAIKHVLADGLKLDTNAPNVGLCVPCVHGKQHCDPFPEKASHRSKCPLECIHSDLHKVPCLTHSGFCYWLTFIDDCTHYCWIYLLWKKNEALPAFKLFKVLVEKQYGYLICILQEDKGGKFIGNQSVVQDESDTEEDSPGESSTEPVGADSGFTPVIDHVSHPSTPPPVKQETPEATPHLFFNLRSLTPAPSPVCPALPPEPMSPTPTPEPGPSNPWWSGQSNKGVAPPSNWFNATDYLRGQTKGKHVESYHEPSLHGTPSPCAGSPSSNAWRESSVPILSNKEEEEANVPLTHPQNKISKSGTDDDEDIDVLPACECPAAHLARHMALETSVSPLLSFDALIAQGLSSVYNNDAVFQLTDAFEHAFHATALKVTSPSGATEPKSFCKAMAGPDADQWYQAAAAEMQAHLKNGTWELVKLPAGQNAIGSKWVFKVKHNADGSVERYKAWLVGQGFSQCPGVDFTETFAPTTKWAALCTIFALAAIEDLKLESVDISNAYLNGVLKDVEVYIKQPEGFTVNDSSWVAKLQKGLYSMKQGSHCWYEWLDETLQGMGFRQLHSDASIFIWEQDGVKVILPVFVDDITLASKSKDKIKELKQQLAEHFKLHDLGPTTFQLGVEIIYDRPNCTLHLSQCQYVLDMHDCFGFTQCSPVSTPLDPGMCLDASMAATTPEDIAFMQTGPYINAVGALMYLAIATHPDIAHVVGVLCHFMSNPGPAHWKAVKHLFCYLSGTLDQCLTYAPDPSAPELFHTYSDADHAGNSDNGWLTSGYVVKIGTGAVSWSLKLQSIVALSTTEAEYVAAVSAGQETLWMHQFLGELGYDCTVPSPMFMDNQSAIQVVKNPEHHGHMKHLDLRFFWLRDEVAKGHLSAQYIWTADIATDLLTKPLACIKVQIACQLLGLTPLMPSKHSGWCRVPTSGGSAEHCGYVTWAHCYV